MSTNVERPNITPPADLPAPDTAGIPSLTRQQLQLTDYWYSYVNLQAGAGLKSDQIKPTTTRQFGLHVHKLVADHVALELHRWHDTEHDYLDRKTVQAHLGTYFAEFPPYNQTAHHPESVRLRYQDTTIAEARKHALTYPEVTIVSALRLAFRRREQQQATRAMQALLSAYGRTLLGHTVDTSALLH